MKELSIGTWADIEIVGCRFLVVQSRWLKIWDVVLCKEYKDKTSEILR